MRIAIIAIGSRGDVQPYLALGLGLIKAGHTVRFVTQQNFEILVKSYGLEFWPVRGSSQDVAGSQEIWELSEKGNFFATLRHIQKSAELTINEWMEDGLAACQGIDLLISGTTALIVGVSLAEKRHLPAIRAHVIPAAPTRAFPSILF